MADESLRLCLGPIDSFGKLPAAVVVEERQYFLVGDNEGYRLISRICAHSGGIVNDVGSCFQCPQHSWKYDRSSGNGITAPSSQLANVPVEVKDGQLWVEVEHRYSAPGAAGQESNLPDDLEVRFHSHACFETRFRGFSILTDPWLNGPAMLGAWLQYPPPVIDARDLQPDVILLTHEHSDHFHEQTLELLDRSTPMFVPDFPNQRMQQILARMGFTDITAMRFGETYELGPDIKLTCFEPASYWNDSIILMDFDGFRLLNLNDAGQNQRISSMIGPVDVMATGFSSTASGYPITWSHLSTEQKKKIIQLDMEGTLLALEERVRLYQPKYLFPIASYFGLWHPSHAEYAKLARNNSPFNLLELFKDSPVQVIDLLPGESWDVPTGEITRYWEDPEKLFTEDYKMQYLKEHYDESKFQKVHPPVRPLSESQVRDYFLVLNEVPDIALCEDLSALVVVTKDEAEDIRVSFSISNGKLIISEGSLEHADVRMEVPERVMGSLVIDNNSWDEAHIGYWCNLTGTTTLTTPDSGVSYKPRTSTGLQSPLPAQQGGFKRTP